MKKGQSNSMWFLIAIVMALAILLIYSFMSGGIVKKAMKTIGLIDSSNDLRIKCTVAPGTGGDTNGDGIVDTDECKKFAKTDTK